jgi:hypothetical protein
MRRFIRGRGLLLFFIYNKHFEVNGNITVDGEQPRAASAWTIIAQPHCLQGFDSRSALVQTAGGASQGAGWNGETKHALQGSV